MLSFIFLQRCQYSQTGPSEIHLPVSKASNFETNDSSFLKISNQDENYSISFLNKKVLIPNLNVLDSFFQKNKELIHKNKVIVSGFENVKKFNYLRDLLFKNGISKFYLNKL